MKRTVCILLVLTMMFGIASCATEKTSESSRTRSIEKDIIESNEEDDADIDEPDEKVEVDINELKKLDGVMFSGNNSKVTTVKLGTVLKNLSFAHMEKFTNPNFKLTYDGSSSDLKTKVTTTQSNYDTDKEITCECSDGVSLKWKQSTGSWQ